MGNWEKYQIKDIGRVITGRTPSEHNPEHWGDYLPFITPSDMDGRRTITQSNRYLSQEGAKALERNMIPYGVGVSCIGWQMGKSILIDEPCITNQQINTIITNENLVDRHFLYYNLSSRRDEIFRLGIGGSRTPILKKSDFEKLIINLPPLPEQRAIAQILGSLDDKIELNRRMNTTLEATARALFQSWFVDFDPVHAKARGEQPSGMDATTAALFPDHFEDSPLGPIPAGWQLCHLGEIAQVKGGKRLPKDRNLIDSVTEHPYLRVKDFAKTGIDRSDIKYIDEETRQTVRRYIITNNDVYISIAGTIGRAGIVPPDLSGANLTENAAKICEIAPEVNKYYLLYFLQSPNGQAQIASRVVGSTQPKLALFRIAELLTVIPPTNLMQIAAEFFEANGSIINKLQIQNKTLAEIRDALLPKLVSGEVRTSDIEV